MNDHSKKKGNQKTEFNDQTSKEIDLQDQSYQSDEMSLPSLSTDSSLSVSPTNDVSSSVQPIKFSDVSQHQQQQLMEQFQQQQQQQQQQQTPQVQPTFMDQQQQQYRQQFLQHALNKPHFQARGSYPNQQSQQQPQQKYPPMLQQQPGQHYQQYKPLQQGPQHSRLQQYQMQSHQHAKQYQQFPNKHQFKPQIMTSRSSTNWNRNIGPHQSTTTASALPQSGSSPSELASASTAELKSDSESTMRGLLEAGKSKPGSPEGASLEEMSTHTASASSSTSRVTPLTAREFAEPEDFLDSFSTPRCSICLQKTPNMRFLHCLHVYCDDCIRNYIATAMQEKQDKEKAEREERERKSLDEVNSRDQKHNGRFNADSKEPSFKVPCEVRMFLKCVKCDNEQMLPSCPEDLPRDYTARNCYELELSGIDTSLPEIIENNHINFNDRSNASIFPKVPCNQCNPGQSRGPVVARCLSCPNDKAGLCRDCVMAHRKMNHFKDHVIYGIELLTLKSKPLNCNKHPREVLEYFCPNLSCNTTVCNICVKERCFRLSHAFMSLVECNAPVDNLEQMKNTVDLANIQIPNIIQTKEFIEQSKANMNKQYDQTRSDIETSYQKAINFLESRKKSLMQEAELSFKDKVITLESYNNELNRMLVDCKRASNYYSRLCHLSSQVELLSAKQLIECKLNSVAKFHPVITGPCAFLLNHVPADAQCMFVSAVSAMGCVMQGKQDYGNDKNSQTVLSYPIENPADKNRNSRNREMSEKKNEIHLHDILSYVTSLINNGGAECEHGARNFAGDAVGAATHNKKMTVNVNEFCEMLKKMNSSNSGNGDHQQSYYSKPAPSSRPSSQLARKPEAKRKNSIVDVFSTADQFQIPEDEYSNYAEKFPPKPLIENGVVNRRKLNYVSRFGESGTQLEQFAEPSGVCVNSEGEILVADTNNHKIKFFTPDGKFIRYIGDGPKNEGLLVYPNRVAICPKTNHIVVTERPPSKQVQVFTSEGVYVRRFGSNIILHPRGLCVDLDGNIIVLESKIMRTLIYDQYGTMIHTFECEHVVFANSVAVNEHKNIFITDNRNHGVDVYNFYGNWLRRIGGMGITNYPVGVNIGLNEEIIVTDNHNNFNITVFDQAGRLLSAFESRVKHAQCFDVCLNLEGSVILSTKDYKIFTYKFPSDYQRSIKMALSSSSSPAPNELNNFYGRNDIAKLTNTYLSSINNGNYGHNNHGNNFDANRNYGSRFRDNYTYNNGNHFNSDSSGSLVPISNHHMANGGVSFFHNHNSLPQNNDLSLRYAQSILPSYHQPHGDNHDLTRLMLNAFQNSYPIPHPLTDPASQHQNYVQNLSMYQQNAQYHQTQHSEPTNAQSNTDEAMTLLGSVEEFLSKLGIDKVKQMDPQIICQLIPRQIFVPSHYNGNKNNGFPTPEASPAICN